MTLGHAWGGVFDDEMSAITSGFGLMIISFVG